MSSPHADSTNARGRHLETIDSTLKAFRESVRLAAVGASYRKAVAAFGTLGNLQESDLKGSMSASLYIDSGPAKFVMFQLARADRKPDEIYRTEVAPRITGHSSRLS